jgi:hypothetical protein
MQLKVELTVEEIEEALKKYVEQKITIAGYKTERVDFIYEGLDDDYVNQPIEGAFVTLDKPVALLSPSAEPLAPEGWRVV